MKQVTVTRTSTVHSKYSQPLTRSAREILQGTTFNENEIFDLERAVVNILPEVRSEFQILEEKAESEKDPSYKLRAGLVAYMLGKHERAEGYLVDCDDSLYASFYLGRVYVALERFEEAEAAFEASEKLGFDHIECRLHRAGAVRALGRLEEAEQIVRSASQGGTARAEYSYQMGCILSDRSDTYGAVEYFERACDMDPYHSRALFSLAGENYLRGNDHEAIALYERSLARPPIYLNALLNLGLLYEEVENYRAAAFCFRRVLETYPNHERAWLYLKDIEAASDMYYDEEALRNQARLNQLLQTPVTDFELSVRSRNCLQRMGVRNLGDLTQTSEQELLAGKNFGETSLHEIRHMLESRGLSLGQNVNRDPRVAGRETPSRQENLSPQEQALLGRPVADLNLSVRARKCMSRLAITTIGELTSRTPDELLESKNFGVTSLNEVRQKLTDMGLKLRND